MSGIEIAASPRRSPAARFVLAASAIGAFTMLVGLTTAATVQGLDFGERKAGVQTPGVDPDSFAHRTTASQRGAITRVRGYREHEAIVIRNGAPWLVELDEKSETLWDPPEPFFVREVDTTRSRIALGGDGGRIAIFDGEVRRGEAWSECSIPGTVSSIALSADGERLAAASETGEIRLWRLGAGEPVLLYLEQASAPVLVAVAGEELVVAPSYGPVRVRDAKGDWRKLEPFDRGTRVALAVEPERGLGLVVSAVQGSKGGTLSRWTLLGDKVPEPFLGDPRVAALAFSSDGTRLLVGTKEGFVEIWATATSSWLQTRLTTPMWQPVRSVAFAGDGRVLVARGEPTLEVEVLDPRRR